MNNAKTILLIGRTGDGKSTLANVIIGKNKFGESAGGISETKKVQIEEFEEDDIKYRIVDTVGIGDTGMELNKVLRKLALMGYSVKDGVSQIFFITDGRLMEEATKTYNLLKEVVFDKDIAKYTTIVRTKFDGFRNDGKCQEDIEKIIENSENLRELIERCNKVIHVDNPPIDIKDDEGLVPLNKERREESRRKLLEHLKDDIIPYKPTNLNNLSGMINEFMEKKRNLKEGWSEGKFGKGTRRVKNKWLNGEITNKMLEHIGKIDPGLKKNIKTRIKKNKVSGWWWNKDETAERKAQIEVPPTK